MRKGKKNYCYPFGFLRSERRKDSQTGKKCYLRKEEKQTLRVRLAKTFDKKYNEKERDRQREKERKKERMNERKREEKKNGIYI